MSELYQLEHKVLPGFIFPEEKDNPMNVFMIGNMFSDICLDYIRFARGIKDENTDIGYNPEDFIAEPTVVKDEGKPVYYITRFRFPFMEDISFSTLCPRTYLVHGLRGENPHYYTIEYDQLSFVKPGEYWLCGWAPGKKGGLIHLNMGQIDLDEQGELRKLVDMNNKYFGIV